MNYGLIAIFDNDADYANSLADFFRLKGGISSEIVVFTLIDSFEEYAKKHTFDILLINEEFIPTVTVESESLQHNIFTLCERKTIYEDNAGICLFKYTSAEEVLRQVMANYKPVVPGVTIPFVDKQKSKIVGIYSPLNRCGKTSFALALAMQISLTSSCIFLSFDDFSTLGSIACDNYTQVKTLDDLLYYFAQQSSEIFDSKLLSVVKKVQHLDFIPPSEQSCAIGEMNSSERILFIQGLINTGRYDYIFVDMGATSPVYPLLQLCHKIYVPTLDGDAYSDLKVKHFMASLGNTTSDSKISIERVSPPVINYNSHNSEYIYALTSGEMAQYVTSLLHNIDI